MERRLAAIIAADVVGYSRLMERDEAGTFERLRQIRTQVVEPAIGRHHGRVFKVMGDGLLAEFGSAVHAVDCAAAIQQAMSEANAGLPGEKRIDMRIGIHVGDVIIDGEDRHGEAVNVAARLQQIAEPGGICVSRQVMGMARQKVAFGFDLLGEEKLKNMVEAIAVYSVRLDRTSSREVPPLPPKPSIAVLPFNNLSGDPEQEYFADGVVEEIITALSRMRWLFVIARNSSFTYKGRAVDVKQVGRELGVRYVLEGSMRKAGPRVRITAQLIDAASGAHLWADHFDGALEDIFELQEQLTTKVVGAIAPKLEQAEIDRSKRKPTENLDAYDYYLRGMAHVHLWTREGNEEALLMFRRAIELDPNFASAYGMMARCYSQRKVSGWRVDRKQETAEAEWFARRAAELGRDDPVALATAGIAFGYVVGDLDRGAASTDRAIELDSNLAAGWLWSAFIRVWLGDPELALQHVERAMRLSPHDPMLFNMQACTAAAHFFAGRYAEASAWALKAVRDNPRHLLAQIIAAASTALTGRITDAQRTVERVLQIDPSLSIANLQEFVPLRRSEDVSRFAEGLRKAGLPE
jgi:TolB-like protein/Tfp pilus assembly protein PilF